MPTNRESRLVRPWLFCPGDPAQQPGLAGFTVSPAGVAPGGCSFTVQKSSSTAPYGWLIRSFCAAQGRLGAPLAVALCAIASRSGAMAGLIDNVPEHIRAAGGWLALVNVVGLQVRDVYQVRLRRTEPSGRRVAREVSDLRRANPEGRAKAILKMAYWPKLLEAVLVAERTEDQAAHRARKRRRREFGRRTATIADMRDRLAAKRREDARDGAARPLLGIGAPAASSSSAAVLCIGAPAASSSPAAVLGIGALSASSSSAASASASAAAGPVCACGCGVAVLGFDSDVDSDDDGDFGLGRGVTGGVDDSDFDFD